MNRVALVLVVGSVLLSSRAQFALTAGRRARAATVGDTVPPAFAMLAGAFGHPLVWLGLLLYAASAVVWLLVLARLDVSLAYPFVALGFIVTSALGWLVFGEQLGAQRIAGTLIIAVGVVVLARS